MKKLIAALAVLAVAAAAQADLLSTWTISSSVQKWTPEETTENSDQITFHNFTANGLNATENGAAYRANNWAGGGASLNNGFDLAFDLTDGFKFTLDSISGHMSNANPGAANFVWKNENNDNVTDVGSITEASGSHTVTWLNGTGVWTSSGTLKLRASDGLNYAGANASSTSRTDLQSGLSIYGAVALNDTPSESPEPATLSLLGLGALAMVLRRKLRK